jgi:hypothetical protein
MPGSTTTVPVAQFAQQLKKKYPQCLSVPDEKLVAAFVSKNSQYKAITIRHALPVLRQNPTRCVLKKCRMLDGVTRPRTCFGRLVRYLEIALQIYKE